MNKKLLLTVLICIVAVAAIGGISFAIWGGNANTVKEGEFTSANWNETEKYLTLERINQEGTTEQIGWRLVGIKKPLKKIVMPSEWGTADRKYPVIEISNAFANNSSVQEIVISSSVKTIADNAFVRFSELKKVTVQEGATLTIGSHSFNGCDQLSEFVYTDATISAIGDSAFGGCTLLTTRPVVKG